MIDEELLKLYAEDLEERKRFSLLRDEKEKLQMRKTMEANDAKRRELVAELTPSLNNPKLRDAKNYFYAASIYNRSSAILDIKKAYNYANKAYKFVQFNNDDFSLQVKKLYNDIAKKLNNTKSPHTKAETNNNQNKLQPTPQMAKKLRDEEKEREKERAKPPTCSRCGKQHYGLCPPRP